MYILTLTIRVNGKTLQDAIDNFRDNLPKAYQEASIVGRKVSKLEVGDEVDVSDPLHEDSAHEHGFFGHIVGFLPEDKIMVQDQEEVVFAVDYDEIEGLKGKQSQLFTFTKDVEILASTEDGYELYGYKQNDRLRATELNAVYVSETETMLTLGLPNGDVLLDVSTKIIHPETKKPKTKRKK